MITRIPYKCLNMLMLMRLEPDLFRAYSLFLSFAGMKCNKGRYLQSPTQISHEKYGGGGKREEREKLIK